MSSTESSSVAVIFEFDETLAPDSTTKFLTSHGVDPQEFWGVRATSLIRSGYDPTIAYMTLFLENIGEHKPFGNLRNRDLRDFGETLNEALYPGVNELIDDLRKITSQYKIQIDFFVISSGLQQVIDGCELIQRQFKGAYGSEFGEDDRGILGHIKRCVTFTEKTRFLFEISKGLDPAETKRNPLLVNQFVPAERRIPFKNMIYVGNPVTDIPCFSILRKEGGIGFGVFEPQRESSARKALQHFFRPDRMASIHAPRYRAKDELGALLRAAVATRCAQMQLDRELVKEY